MWLQEHDQWTNCCRGGESSDILVAFFVEGGPVGDTGIEQTHVHVVEVIWGVCPFATAVVGFEGQIWGGRDTLAGREVSTCIMYQNVL